MATTGSLREIPLAALIETGCRSRASARLQLRHGEWEGEIYFSDGEIVHAVCGDLKGEPALWRLLGARPGCAGFTGSCRLLLQGGAQRSDHRLEGEIEQRPVDRAGTANA